MPLLSKRFPRRSSASEAEQGGKAASEKKNSRMPLSISSLETFNISAEGDGPSGCSSSMSSFPKRFSRRSSAGEAETGGKASGMMNSCLHPSIDELTVETLNISEDEADDPMGGSYLLDVPAPERCEKSVRFRIDEVTGAIDSETYTYDVKLQRKLKSELYYSRTEFRKKVAEVEELAERVHKECPDIPLVLNYLRENSQFMAQDLHDGDREMLLAYSNSKGRGLESYMSDKATERRKMANRRVLKFQSRRHSTGTTDDRWRALAERAAMESQQATCLAAVLGMGDAMVVREPRSRRRSSVRKQTTSSTRLPRRSSVDVAV